MNASVHTDGITLSSSARARIAGQIHTLAKYEPRLSDPATEAHISIKKENHSANKNAISVHASLHLPGRHLAASSTAETGARLASAVRATKDKLKKQLTRK